jgi:hypothetical protein
MRIAVSGTHASGKSTLIADFAAAHPHYVTMPDPFELLDEQFDQPSAGMLLRQLRVAADRLEQTDSPDVIAERSPLDFLAYLLALGELDRATASDEVLERARTLTARALRRVDLLVLLPLNARDRIWIGDDEDPDLREATDAALLDLIDDPDLIPGTARILEITGDRATRLSTLEAVVRD